MKQLLNQTGVWAIAKLDADGILLDYVGRQDMMSVIDKFVANAESLFARFSGWDVVSQQQTPYLLTVEYQHACCFWRPIDEESSLLVVTAKNANMASIRSHTTRLAKK